MGRKIEAYVRKHTKQSKTFYIDESNGMRGILRVLKEKPENLE
jgi:hypothetical protein